MRGSLRFLGNFLPWSPANTLSHGECGPQTGDGAVTYVGMKRAYLEGRLGEFKFIPGMRGDSLGGGDRRRLLEDQEPWSLKPGAVIPCDDPSKVDLSTFRHPNSARFHELLKGIGALHDQKQADYGRGDDPFANVRASEEWGIPGWVGAMIRLNDKVRRLQTLALKGALANEGAMDSFKDIAVYALIAAVLWEQGGRGAQNA